MATETITLRMIHGNEIPYGTPLPGDLCDHTGTTLIQKGRIIDETIKQRLGERVLYVGPDWPPLPSDGSPDKPREVILALADKRGEKVTIDNKRKHVRHPWKVQLDIEVKDPGRDSTSRQIQVQTVDMSAGGFCFIYEQYLHIGTLVTACFEMLPHKPILHGEVRNCAVYRGTHHRIGVQFKQQDTQDKKKQRKA